MIADFDGIVVTDDTSEYKEGISFLLTAQNRKYLNESIRDVIKVEELINRAGLDSLKVIGITGTNGKTTTAAAIYSILLDLDRGAALQGTRGFFVQDRALGEKSLTTPPILKTLYNMKRALDEGCEYFVMEVSSHAIDQNRIEGLDFALKVLTNISHDHLDYHKTMQNYIATKNRFFDDEKSPKLLNKDEPKAKYPLKNAYTYALESPATFQVMAYSLEGGISAVVRFADELADFHSGLGGIFNLYNLTAAVASVKILTGEPLERICSKVENFAGVAGRMERVSYDPEIFVDFAHTPDGMKKVFESFPSKDIVAVFGAGGDRDAAKRAVMGEIASKYCKKIYITSDNPRGENPEKIMEDIYRGVREKKKAALITDRKEAIKRALKELEQGEVLLVLGKGDEEFIEIGDKLVKHSDAKFIKEILRLNHSL